jgi:hypothetical protein
MKFKRGDWRAAKPTRVEMIAPRGHGGPSIPVLPTNPLPGAGSLPSLPSLPSGPTIPGTPGIPAPTSPGILNPLAGIADAVKTAARDFVSAGEVLAGVALIVLGLLLATGLLAGAVKAAPVGRAARVASSVARR